MPSLLLNYARLIFKIYKNYIIKSKMMMSTNNSRLGINKTSNVVPASANPSSHQENVKLSLSPSKKQINSQSSNQKRESNMSANNSANKETPSKTIKLKKPQQPQQPMLMHNSISSSQLLNHFDTHNLGRNAIPLKKQTEVSSKTQSFAMGSHPSISQKSPLRTYNFWIDIKDLHSQLIQVQASLLEYDLLQGCDADASQIIIEEKLNEDLADQRFIKMFAMNDEEAKLVLQRFIKEQSNTLKLNEVFFGGISYVYLIENAKVITQVFRVKVREEILKAIHLIVAKLQTYESKYLNKILRLCFSTESEFCIIIGKIIGNETLRNISVRKICKVIYEACLKFRYYEDLKASNLMNSYLFLKLEMYCRGRDIFDSSKTSYPLHQAIFQENLPMISRLVKGECDGIFFQDKNELDPCGNTPLILAVKLGNIDAIKILCDLTCCPKIKSLSNLPCALDVASSIKVKEIIKILLEANQKIKQHYLEMNKEAMFRALENLPDFKLDMNFQMQSNFIPFLGSIAPSDTYKIYKQGSMLRLDMTLVGFKNLKSIRGNLSVLFKGRSQPNEGELFVIDHDTKSVTNIFNQVVGAKLDKDLEDIMADEQYQKMYKADKFQMEPVIEGRSGTVMKRDIEGFRAEKYKMKTTFTMTKYKIDVGEVQNIRKYQTFEEYIKNAQIRNYGEIDEEEIEVAGRKFDYNDNIQIGSLKGSSQERSNSNLGTNTINEGFSLNTRKQGVSSKDKKITKKTINASIWLCNNHPLSLDSFLPLLQVLSFSSKQISKFKDYLMKYKLPPGTFPLRAKIPIFFTMKAAFSLQNLSLDPADLHAHLFDVDQIYLQQRVPANYMQCKDHTQSAAANLNDIYNLIKISSKEDEQDEEEDLDSIQRAHEMFNSMIKKGCNQSEDLLGCSNYNQEPSQLELSMMDPLSSQHLQSFQSEVDSVDISERQIKDESFKLANHAFSKIKTMNQINVRHEGSLEDTLNGNATKIIIQKAKIQLVNQKGRNPIQLQKSGTRGVAVDGENLFESKHQEDNNKPFVNTTSTKRLMTKMQKPPLIPQPITPSGSISIISQTGKQEFNSSLKNSVNHKNSIKNYKNLIKYSKYGSKNEVLIQSESSYGGYSQGTRSHDNHSAVDCIPQKGKSTAENSLANISKESSGFITGMNWFKQIIEYKNAIMGKKEAPGYLQTIESEEILPTETCQMEKRNFKHSKIGIIQNFGASSILNNNSSLLSQDEEITLRKELQIHNHIQIDKKLYSQSSSSLDHPFVHNSHSQPSKISLTNHQSLKNHKNLINRFQDYVAINNQDSSKQIGKTLMKTPQESMKGNSNNNSQSPSRLIGKSSVDQSFENRNAIGSILSASEINGDFQSFSQTNRGIQVKNQSHPFGDLSSKPNLFPPQISHRRQSSFGENQSSIQHYIQNNNLNNNSAVHGSFVKNQSLQNGSSESIFVQGLPYKQTDAQIGRQLTIKQMPGVGHGGNAGLQNFSASSIYNQTSRQDAHLFMMHAHSHNIPKKSTILEQNDNAAVTQRVVQPFNTFYGDDINSSHSHQPTNKQANLSSGLQTQKVGLLGGPLNKLNALGPSYRSDQAGKIILTESVSSRSLINKGLTSTQQLSKKTSDVDIILSYQV